MLGTAGLTDSGEQLVQTPNALKPGFRYNRT